MVLYPYYIGNLPNPKFTDITRLAGNGKTNIKIIDVIKIKNLSHSLQTKMYIDNRIERTKLRFFQDETAAWEKPLYVRHHSFFHGGNRVREHVKLCVHHVTKCLNFCDHP